MFRPRTDRVYIALDKPYGVLSQFTTQDKGKQTLAGLGLPPGVYPVGRLDQDSEGLLLLSDDPELTTALLHPKRGHKRTYCVQVEGVPDAAALDNLRRGVMVQGKITLPAEVALPPTPLHIPPRVPPVRYRATIPDTWILLTITEGRNRQVRRMTAAVGHPTLRLVRVAIGALELSALGIQRGQWQRLRPDEVLLALSPAKK